MKDELESTKKELDEMTKSMLKMEDGRDMWRKIVRRLQQKAGSRN